MSHTGLSRRKILLIAAALCSLAGCAAERRNADAVLQAREMEWASLRESSYKAVDLMIEQMGPALKPGTLIRVEPLKNTRQTKSFETRPFGLVLSEQIAARFTQKGFPVSDADLTRPPYLLVRGAYTVGDNSVFVNLKMVAPHLNKVVMGHDYAIIMDSDVAALVDPAPQTGRFFSAGPSE